jgi:acyl-coenzyme A synthetase/AMP-(fatty) acid ligase
VEVIKAMPKGDPTRMDLVQAYADAIRMVWVAMVAFAAVGLVASVATEGLSLDRVLMTDQGLRDKKKEQEVNGDA